MPAKAGIQSPGLRMLPWAAAFALGYAHIRLEEWYSSPSREKSSGLMRIPVVPAKAGTQDFSHLPLGPRVRGDDESCPSGGYSDCLFGGGDELASPAHFTTLSQHRR
jgi:hypothetical protein